MTTFAHRRNPAYHKEPRRYIELESSAISERDREDLKKIQIAYRELLHDRLIEDITRNVALDLPIYRIDTLDHVKKDAKNKTLYLPNPCSWTDPWENFILRNDAFLHDGRPVNLSSLRDAFFAQCWSISPDCEGMWSTRHVAQENMCKIQKNGNEGASPRLVKITSTVRKLMREVYKFEDEEGHENFCIGAVQYKHKAEIEKIHALSFKDPDPGKIKDEIFASLLLKRTSFSYEKEVRLICYAQPGGERSDGGLLLHGVDIHNYLESLEIDPWCSVEEFARLKEQLKEYGFYCVERSSLLDPSDANTILLGEDCTIETPMGPILPPCIKRR